MFSLLFISHLFAVSKAYSTKDPECWIIVLYRSYLPYDMRIGYRLHYTYEINLKKYIFLYFLFTDKLFAKWQYWYTVTNKYKLVE